MSRFPAAFVPDGTVTAANSCFDADAASAVVITSLERAREMGASDGLLVLGGCDTAGGLIRNSLVSEQPTRRTALKPPRRGRRRP